MNATGNYKRRIRAEDLVRFEDDRKEKEPFDPEKRRQQMLESARFHKSKFWTLIKGRSLEDVKLPEDVGKIPQ